MLQHWKHIPTVSKSNDHHPGMVDCSILKGKHPLLLLNFETFDGYDQILGPSVRLCSDWHHQDTAWSGCAVVESFYTKAPRSLQNEKVSNLLLLVEAFARSSCSCILFTNNKCHRWVEDLWFFYCWHREYFDIISRTFTICAYCSIYDTFGLTIYQRFLSSHCGHRLFFCNDWIFGWLWAWNDWRIRWTPTCDRHCRTGSYCKTWHY